MREEPIGIDSRGRKYWAFVYDPLRLWVQVDELLMNLIFFPPQSDFVFFVRALKPFIVRLQLQVIHRYDVMIG